MITHQNQKKIYDNAEKHGISTSQQIHYVPIGSNCDVCHYLRKHNLRYEALPFDWNLSSMSMIYHCLSNNFKDFLTDVYIGSKCKRMVINNEETNKVEFHNNIPCNM